MSLRYAPIQRPMNDWLCGHEWMIRKAPGQMVVSDGDWQPYPLYFELAAKYRQRATLPRLVAQVRSLTASLLGTPTNPQELTTADISVLNQKLWARLDELHDESLERDIISLARTVLIHHQQLGAMIDETLACFDVDVSLERASQRALYRLQHHLRMTRDPLRLLYHFRQWDRSDLPQQVQRAVSSAIELFETAALAIPKEDPLAMHLFRKQFTARLLEKRVQATVKVPCASGASMSLSEAISKIGSESFSLAEIPLQVRFHPQFILACLKHDIYCLNQFPVSVFALPGVRESVSDLVTRLCQDKRPADFSRLRKRVLWAVSENQAVCERLRTDPSFFSKLPPKLHTHIPFCNAVAEGLVATLKSHDSPCNALGEDLEHLPQLLGFEDRLCLDEVERALSCRMEFVGWVASLSDPLAYIKRLPSHVRQSSLLQAACVEVATEWGYRQFLKHHSIDWFPIRELFWFSNRQTLFEAFAQSAKFRTLLRHQPFSYYTLPEGLQAHRSIQDSVARALIHREFTDERCLLDHWQAHPRVRALNWHDELERLPFHLQLDRLQAKLEAIFQDVAARLEDHPDTKMLREFFDLSPHHWEQLSLTRQQRPEIFFLFASASPTFREHQLQQLRQLHDAGVPCALALTPFRTYPGILEHVDFAQGLVEMYGGDAFRLLPEASRCDHGVARAAVLYDGHNLFECDFFLQRSLLLIADSFKTRPDNYLDLPFGMQHDFTILHRLVTASEEGLRFAIGYQSHFHLVMAAIQAHPGALRFASRELQANPYLRQFASPRSAEWLRPMPLVPFPFN